MRNRGLPSTVAIPAAQYLRTSTDLQQQSLEHQKTAIQEYATRNGFIVVQTYADLAKSGLGLKQRLGLRQLLQDVVGGNPGYKAVLVYDVSRWGRFQDTDEPAHYEFLCKRSGTPVYYCAEPFVNDGKLSGSIWKALRRSMAGEYSRELSAKCFAGQKRLVELGFRMGAPPGYGLRRMVVASGLKRRKILTTGEYKSLSSDRIILVPGPKEEVECIRRIYDLVLQGKNVTQIAGILNGLGIPYREGKPWRRYAVEEIVINPKYAGSYVWNKRSQTLGQPCVTNLPESWVVKRDAFAPIIDRKKFDRVQRLRGYEKRWSDEQLLDKLRLLLAKKGELSMKLIDATPGMPCATTYHRRLGRFRHIYPMVGYSSRPAASQKSDHRERTRVLREGLIRHLVALFPGKVTVFNLVRDARPMLELDNGVRVAIRICTRRTTGTVRWRLYNGISSHRGHVSLLCLLNVKNDAFDKFYVVPGVESVEGEQIIMENCPFLAAGLRLDSLQELYSAAMHCARKTGYAGRQLRLAIDAA